MQDAVENLAKAYIDIRNLGCIQFDDMMVVVHCNVDHRVAIEVRLQSIGHCILGMKKEKPCIEHCEDLHRYMTVCASKWRKLMDDRRR